jgi:hypothetical protein
MSSYALRTSSYARRVSSPPSFFEGGSLALDEDAGFADEVVLPGRRPEVLPGGLGPRDEGGECSEGVMAEVVEGGGVGAMPEREEVELGCGVGRVRGGAGPSLVRVAGVVMERVLRV